MLYKQQQNVVLDRGKLHRLAIYCHFFQIIVDRQSADCIDCLALLYRRASKLHISAQM